MEGFIIWFGLAAVIGYFANKKGRNPVGWGLLSVVITPFFAAIALAIASDLSINEKIKDVENKTDNLKKEMDYSQKYNDLRSHKMEKKLDEATDKDNQKNIAGTSNDDLLRHLESGSNKNNNNSIADELSKLHELKNEGVLTDEEFEEQKKKILDNS